MTLFIIALLLTFPIYVVWLNLGKLDYKVVELLTELFVCFAFSVLLCAVVHAVYLTVLGATP